MMATPHKRRLYYEGKENLLFSNINKIFKACVGKKIKEDVEMRVLMLQVCNSHRNKKQFIALD